MPLRGGEETRVLEKPPDGDWANWALARNGIYFFDWVSDSDQGLRFFEFITGKTTRVWTTKNRSGVGLSVSADGKPFSTIKMKQRSRHVGEEFSLNLSGASGTNGVLLSSTQIAVTAEQ
jgi:hypothetical protein